MISKYPLVWCIWVVVSWTQSQQNYHAQKSAYATVDALRNSPTCCSDTSCITITVGDSKPNYELCATHLNQQMQTVITHSIMHYTHPALQLEACHPVK